MKIVGKKPIYLFDNISGSVFSLNLSTGGIVFWACSDCGELYATVDSYGPPEELEVFTCRVDDDRVRGIFINPENNRLLLCQECARKERDKRSGLSQCRTIQR